MAITTPPPLVADIDIPQFRQDSVFRCSQQSLTFSEVLREIKMLYTIALPLIITGLLIYGKSLISMLFLGRLGKDVLAGGSLAMGIANITGYSVIAGLAMGMEAISSQAFGAKQWPLMGQTLQRTIIILLVACFPISLLWLNIQPILVLCNQDPNISAIAATFLTFCLPDLVFQSLIHPLRIYLRSQNITQPLIISAALSLALHAPINYFFIHYFKLGVKGIALAVVVTDLNILLTLVIYVFFSGIQSKPWLVSLSVFQNSDQEWRSILGLALPSCCSVCLEWWWYELMILLSGILPNAAEAVAAMGILLQATSFVYIFPSALSMAVSTRVGNELGANQPERARASSLIALLCAIITSLVAMAFMVIFRGNFGRAFTSDATIVALTATIMPVVGLCEIGNCPQTTGCGVLRGSARPTVGANINLGSFYVIGLPLAVFLGFWIELGLLGLWLGLLLAQLTCAVLMGWAFWRTNWILQVERARKLIGVGINREGGEGEQREGLLSII